MQLVEFLMRERLAAGEKDATEASKEINRLKRVQFFMLAIAITMTMKIILEGCS